jgi:2-methylcitrate dehydratase PrpD
MSPGSVVDNREMPDVCIQHMIAIMLIDKTATFRSAHDKLRMQEPAVLRQRAKVRLDPGSRPLVVVTLTDGTRLAEDVTAVLGTVNNPMTREQVVAKSRDLMTPVVGAGAAGKVIEKALDLDNVRSIRELRRVLQPTS